MPSGSIKTAQEAEDFVLGCTFMGTGGGGDPSVGLRFLLEDLKEGREIRWVDMSQVPDDAWTCTPFYMGSIAPPSPDAKRRMKQLGLVERKHQNTLINAIKQLQEYRGISVQVIVPAELGGINTPAPLDAAARMGLTAVDGDYAGRAIPEIGQATPVLYDRKLCPITSVDTWGNACIIRDAVNYDVAEALGKMISTVAYGLCGQSGFAMPGREMKEAVVPRTLTECVKLGAAIRKAREKGADPVQAAVEAVKGWLLFKGKVAKKEWEDKEGYMYGVHTFKGIAEYKGHTFKIWFKNENHISWKDNRPYVTSPDIMEVVQLKTANPITNTNLKEGDTVAIIGKKNEKYRTEKGLRVLGPTHFGFKLKYTPIEKLVR